MENLPGEVTCLIYADDVVLICGGRNPEKTEAQLQEALNVIEDWQHKTGFRISADKCATMTFKRRRSRQTPKTSSLTLNEVVIPKQKTYRCLGVVFDQSLQFKQHIEEVRSSCQQRMKLLRCIAGSSWGGDRETVSKLYNATILEKKCYMRPRYCHQRLKLY